MLDVRIYTLLAQMCTIQDMLTCAENMYTCLTCSVHEFYIIDAYTKRVP